MKIKKIKKINKMFLILAVLPITANATAVYNAILDRKANIIIEEYDPTPSVFNSCKEIKENGFSVGDGIYTIENNSKSYDVYCDMTFDDGGWTLVAAQYENNPVSWDNGISEQVDYDPSLNTKISFALSEEELPSDRTLISMTQSYYDIRDLGRISAEGRSSTTGYGSCSVFYHVFKYTTNTIPKTQIESRCNGVFDSYYNIHRDPDYYYSNHDPDNTPIATGTTLWGNTLTVEYKSNNNTFYGSWAFNPVKTPEEKRGYAYRGFGGNTSSNWHLRNTSDDGAWLIWVK